MHYALMGFRASTGLLGFRAESDIPPHRGRFPPGQGEAPEKYIDGGVLITVHDQSTMGAVMNAIGKGL